MCITVGELGFVRHGWNIRKPHFTKAATCKWFGRETKSRYLKGETKLSTSRRHIKCRK